MVLSWVLLFSMTKCLSAMAAIWGRWVMHSTWWAWATVSSCSETRQAVLPLMPVSISSKIRVSMSSLPASTVLMASMMRDSSPPLATWLKALTPSPGLVEIRNSTSS